MRADGIPARGKTPKDGAEPVTIAGLITNVDRRVSKNGNPWAIVTIEDLDGVMQCSFFGQAYVAYASQMEVDAIVKVTGFVDVQGTAISLKARSMHTIDLGDDDSPLTIIVGRENLLRDDAVQLQQLLLDNPGLSEVRLALVDGQGRARVLTFGDRFRVRKDTALAAALKSLFGPHCIG